MSHTIRLLEYANLYLSGINTDIRSLKQRQANPIELNKERFYPIISSLEDRALEVYNNIQGE